jgi:hypothetical protein
MDNVEIIDNFLGFGDWQRLCSIVDKPKWSAKYLYPTNHLSRIWQWDFFEDQDEICSLLIEPYSERSGEKYKMSHMYVNGQTTAMDSNPHTDRSYKTLIYFPMRQWLSTWGGHLMIWEGERDKSNVISILPEPNRLIVIDNKNGKYPWHFAQGPNSLSDRNLRISIGLHVELENE